MVNFMYLQLKIQQFTNENGQLYFQNKQDMLEQYYRRVLNKPFPLPTYTPTELFEKVEAIQNPLEQMQFYYAHSSPFLFFNDEINLMFHYQSYSIFANITQNFIDSLADFIGGNSVLEICAGSGYLAKGLQEKGITIFPTDLFPTNRYSTVEPLDAVAAVTKYYEEIDYVLLTWSPLHSDLDMKVLNKIRELNRLQNRKVQMIVIGELGGCTNSAEFNKKAKIINDETFLKVQRNYESFAPVKDAAYLIE